MQAPQRQCQPDLIGRLFDEPWQFSFASAVTLLLRWLVQSGVPHDEAMTRVLRFQNSVSLAFPAAEVEALRVEELADEMRIVLTPRCIGLLGAAGVLPLHDTDRCAHTAARGDAGARAYLDGCSTRMVALFWRAWAKPRLELAPIAEGHDSSRDVLLGLGGRQESVLEEGAWFAGLLRTRPVSAESIERIVGGGLGLPARVESMAGFWDLIPDEKRSTLGTENPVLGHSFVLGASMWRVDRRIRIVIGPLDREDFDSLLPGGSQAATLRELLMLATPNALLEFEICLLPAPGCLGTMVLADRPGDMCRLGYDTMLAGPPAGRREVRYLLELRPEGDSTCL